MEKILLMEKYPVYIKEIKKSETSFRSCDEIINYLKESIKNHKIATFIAIFDHLSHTKSLKEGKVDEDMIAAKDIVFCFGKELLKAQVLGVRPRSIGVCEYEDRFIISFMEAPNPEGNASMIEWVENLKKS